ncbi:MAG: Hsp20/alpha crystallin family protein [Anaerolineae bacterium]
MLSWPRSPLQEMERLRREMNRLFSEWPLTGGLSAPPSYPAMNVWVSDEDAIVTAEVPGCDPENIDISVVGDTLVLKGDRPAEDLPEGATYHRRERACGSFSRSFRLPFEVNADEVGATFEDGVLHITLPRSEESKPRKITVRAA